MNETTTKKDAAASDATASAAPAPAAKATREQAAKGPGKQKMTREKCIDLGLDPTVYGYKAKK